ncbi:PadR family transcriptional regulator [Nocardia terpenica]|uniref:Putative transcriptional regulator n=1 Tax=Nocardia terpenica TaxID=455432 RepID=A0A809Q7F4_9NOCA|nr:PadR family transcriptional regulator [Nocardia terpenica]MBF6066119.1 PadR family transcriptional regulator [Nocardia terpenica]MBF6109190.1 PadR family transcriptional regulator [Nocardia terpenica]MBF6116363.1 PadR family transcriptional regulator [Nocardia terpenica]MBF6123520.1 PadR family transcriptional regulator [Nocardia terpenica]MBF6156797.1 PadR family transcriptional regulator [Nocardia terpenica]
MASFSGSRMLDSSLLLLLAERPDHGYSLRNRLEHLGLDFHGEPGALYRRLHVLERRGLVEHRVDHSHNGRKKKVYSTTVAGIAELGSWASSLQGTLEIIQQWLAAHASLSR